MKTYKTEGIILKRRNLSEADRIITLLTKRNGKIQVKAVGVRKITSRRSAHLELFNHTVVSLYQGKKFSIVTEAHTLESFSVIRHDLTKIAYSYHLCELVDSLCPENQENTMVFFLLLETFRKLQKEENISSVVSSFEISLLKCLGFYPKTLPYNFNTSLFIEQIIERKLKTKSLLPRLI